MSSVLSVVNILKGCGTDFQKLKCRHMDGVMAYSAKGRTKGFPVFDGDSDIYEPPEVWDKYIPQNNRDFAKTHFYRDADRLFLVRNSRISFRDPDKWKYPVAAAGFRKSRNLSRPLQTYW